MAQWRRAFQGHFDGSTGIKPKLRGKHTTAVATIATIGGPIELRINHDVSHALILQMIVYSGYMNIANNNRQGLGLGLGTDMVTALYPYYDLPPYCLIVAAGAG